MKMSTTNALLTELEKSAFAGDPTARLVLEHPITALLLKELIETPVPAYIRFDVPHTGLILKDGKRRVIHGYASVEMIDKQQELITIPALQKAWERMVAAGEKYANLNLEHSNITIGKILLKDAVEDSKGTKYWSHVDDKGLYIVAELRDDIEIADKVWEMANKGDLNSYSIGGRALKKGLAKENGQTFWKIDDLELYEITVCKRGKNNLSGFEVLKSYLENGLIDQTTFLQKNEELKKSEKLIRELAFLPNLMGKSLIIRKDFICQIGSSVEKGEGADFDLLVKMDVDNPMRRHIETRILKALPSALWDKLEFVFGDEGGPHDTYRPLFDLALVPADKLARVEMAKAEVETSTSEQSSEQSSRTLKNMVDGKTGEESSMAEQKAIGTPGLTGTATGPQSGGVTGTTREGEDIASLGARVKKLEMELEEMRKAKKPEEEEEEKAKKKPCPEEEEKAKKPEEEEEEKAKKKYPYPEEEKGKKKYPYPDEKEASEGEIDPDVLGALEGLETKGKLPAGLKRWLAEHRKKKGEDDRIAQVEARVEKMSTDVAAILEIVKAKKPEEEKAKPKEEEEKAKKPEEEVKKSDLSEADVKRIAEKTSDILRSASPTVKKSEATPGVSPDTSGGQPVGIPTLETLHKMSWRDVEELDAKRRAALLGVR